VIVESQDLAARGIAEAITLFLEPNRPEAELASRTNPAPAPGSPASLTTAFPAPVTSATEGGSSPVARLD
jgi:hypothetical protein